MTIVLTPEKYDRFQRLKREVLDALPDPPYVFDGAYAMAVAADMGPEDSWERGFMAMFVLRCWVIDDDPNGEAPGLTAR